MKGTKIINWGTPKRIQEEADRKKASFKPHKKIGYCKKTKGEHVVEWSDWRKFTWTKGMSRDGKCKLCGKKFWEVQQ